MADKSPGDSPFDVQEAAVAAQAQLTPEEVAEFRALRAEKKAHDDKVAAEVEAAAARLQPDTHFVHLADGSVTTGSTIATHVDNGGGPLPVLAAALKPEYVSFPG